MFLKFRVPEISRRLAMLAGEETRVGRMRIVRESERKGHLERCAVGPFAFAFESIEFEIADAGFAKLFSVGGAAAVENEHRQALPVLEEIAVEGAKGKMPRPVWLRSAVVGHCEQFDKSVGSLDDVVLRAP